MSRQFQACRFFAGTPASTPSAVGVEQALVPAGLLDGGELVLLAVKPSLWFIVLQSGWWLIGMALLAAGAWYLDLDSYSKLTVQLPAALALVRVSVAMFQWASRLYVLTNRRVMRIKGVLHVDVFECPLSKIQNTFLTFSLPERAVRIGSIHILTAGTGSVEAVWQHISQPLAVHTKLREAIARSQRTGNGL